MAPDAHAAPPTERTPAHAAWLPTPLAARTSAAPSRRCLGYLTPHDFAHELPMKKGLFLHSPVSAHETQAAIESTHTPNTVREPASAARAAPS